MSKKTRVLVGEPRKVSKRDGENTKCDTTTVTTTETTVCHNWDHCLPQLGPLFATLSLTVPHCASLLDSGKLLLDSGKLLLDSGKLLNFLTFLTFLEFPGIY